MTADEMLCRWAEKKYGLASVTRVEFTFHDDGDYSELTPGDGPYMRVTVSYLGSQGKGPQTHKRVADTVYDTGLIREILDFAMGSSS